jgi:two-component system, OmpR family, sensor kinase
VESRGSFIRSAARGTSSAYRRLPIRWRLAGGSAVLTLVILCGFATIVGVLTTQQIESDFNRQVAGASDELQRSIGGRLDFNDAGQAAGIRLNRNASYLEAYAASYNAAIRIVTGDGRIVRSTEDAPYLPPPRTSTEDFGGWRVESREIPIEPFGTIYVQYARRLSDVQATADRVKVFLGLGVLGGAALALLAGLATATRAMTPITRLTEAAREIERSRDPSLRIPHPQSEDEVAELARTFEGMLHALDDSRGETEAALARQREFVADASHELRTPLTSVLANLELLEEELEGEPREAAASALRSSRRMRRLVGDLLLLARADAGRRAQPHVPLDLSDVLTEAAGELEPVAGEHPITVSAAPGAHVEGARDELHRLALNLLENALRHTDPGTAVEATVERRNGEVVLAVEDDGPGIPPELQEKVFERFFRGAGDRSGSSGLGLAIVRAVAESHRGEVSLEPPLDGRGARFVVRLPAHT